MARGSPSDRGKRGASKAGRKRARAGRRPATSVGAVPADRVYTAEHLSSAAALSDEQEFWDLSSELFAVFDAQGRFVRINPAWERILGWTGEQLIGRPALELVHPDDCRPRSPAASEHAAARVASLGRRPDPDARTGPTVGCCGQPTSGGRIGAASPRRSPAARRPKPRGRLCAPAAKRRTRPPTCRPGSGTCGVVV